ncbi:MAG TPA: hypothetical protein PK431_14920 [Chitinophagales bacterium]|nr:hypothetical protein [Chitinophagales bacterium]
MRVRKYLVILFYSFLLGHTCPLKAQNILGKYVEDKSDSLLFKGILTLNTDSTFIYEGVGTLKDSASGIFSLKTNILYLKYNDGCSQEFLKRKRFESSYPIEMIGFRLTCDGRPKKLMYENKRLYRIYVNKTKLKRKKEQKSEYYFQLSE